MAEVEPLIREHPVCILENLPVDEIFNWMQEVSIDMTGRMRAMRFDPPYQERHKLIHWSDIKTAVRQISSDDSIDMNQRWQELQLRVLREEIMKHFHRVERVGDVIRLPNNFVGGIKAVPVRRQRI